MRKIISAVLLAVIVFSGAVFAADKGRFNVTAGMKMMDFDVVGGEDSVTLYGVSIGGDVPVLKLKYGQIDFTTSVGYYMGKDDIGNAVDVTVTDVSMDVGFGYSFNVDILRFGAGILVGFDYVDFDSISSESGFSAGVYGDASIEIGENMYFGVRAKRMAVSNDVIESYTTVEGILSLTF